MKPQELLLRCIGEKDGNVWVASCIDLCLAAQGDSFQEAKKGLHSMIVEYIYDAVAGEDQAHAAALLSRKAPFPQVAKYHYYKAIQGVHNAKHAIHRTFTDAMPLAPCAKA